MAMIIVDGLEGIQNASQAWVTHWEKEGRSWRYVTKEELRDMWASRKPA